MKDFKGYERQLIIECASIIATIIIAGGAVIGMTIWAGHLVGAY